jgi:methionine-rich copper-binding protein CopC/putative copper export protein
MTAGSAPQTFGVRRWMRVTIAVAVVAIGLPGGVASAHAIVESITPGDGSVLAEGPQHVVVTFSEPMLADGLEVDVTPSADHDLPSSAVALDPTDARRVIIDLGPMDQGIFQVRLVARDAEDLHEVVARTSFAIGDAAPPPSPPVVASYEPVETVARWAFAAGLALIVGVMAVRYVWPAVADRGPRRTRALVVAGVALVVTGRLGTLVGRMLSLGSDVGSAAVTVARTADAERLLLVGIAVGCVLVTEFPRRSTWLDVPVRRQGRLSVRQALGWVGAVNLAVLAAWGGHSALDGSTAPITVLAKAGHLIGLGLWLGVLIVVLILAGSDWRHGMSVMGRTAIAGACIAVYTGVLLASRLVISFTAVRATPYGVMLALKLVLLAGAVGLGMWVRHTGRRCGSYAELIVLAVVVLFGAAMATATPALDPAFSNGPATTSPIRPAVSADDLLVQARGIPGRPGLNTIEVRIGETRRPSLGPITDVEIHVAGQRVRATPQAGLAFVEGVVLPGGESSIDVTIHRDGWTDARAVAVVDAWPQAYVAPTWISSARLRTPLELSLVGVGLLAAFWMRSRRPTKRSEARTSRLAVDVAECDALVDV